MAFSGLIERYPTQFLAATLCIGYLLPQPPASEAQGISLQGPSTLITANGSSKQGPRVSVFEADAWRHSLKDGSLEPVPALPLPQALTDWLHTARRRDLLRDAHFTPAAYLDQIAQLRNTYSAQRDILMYYGGIRRRPNPEGLNFNAWSAAELRRLRALDCRPFIGLETMDRQAIRSLAWRLKEAGYNARYRIYIRIGAEPAYAAYGTEDGTSAGKRHTRIAFSRYQGDFARTSAYLNDLNRRLGLNIHSVFAGANNEDFAKYQPPAETFDAIGYDLYVTPENKSTAFKQLRQLARRYPWKPLVIPEFGIATEGPKRARFPRWAAETLGEVLEEFSRHPAGVEEITVFSVNVPARIQNRRWSWAWTPMMYEMLKEWQAAPRRWRKAGFHRYDPASYPVGRDVLYIDRPDLRIVYRKLAEQHAPGVPFYQEVVLNKSSNGWLHSVRRVYFLNGKIRES
jgi:hypothetical protein